MPWQLKWNDQVDWVCLGAREFEKRRQVDQSIQSNLSAARKHIMLASVYQLGRAGCRSEETNETNHVIKYSLNLENGWLRASAIF